MATVYYSEFDAHAAQWLRNLIDAGLITPGAVDERSIHDVRATDLVGHERVHLFAGIAGWEYALRLAGWPDGREVWSGSCPCQPFSSAGKRKGTADERHLWPEFYRLIRECRPECVFGEQVASNDGYAWLDGVRADVEREGFAFAAADLPAVCVGAPHRRQRLFWVAYAGPPSPRLDEGYGGGARKDTQSPERRSKETGQPGRRGRTRDARRLGDADGGDARDGHEQRGGEHGQQPADGGPGPRRLGDAGRGARRVRGGVPRETGGDADSTPRQGDGDAADDSGADGRLGDAGRDGLQGQHVPRLPPGATERADGAGLADFWADFDLLPCRDNKVRRSEPGLLPVVDGTAFLLADGRTREGVSRAKVLRGIGNAIVPQVAAKFIRAFMECVGIEPEEV